MIVYYSDVLFKGEAIVIDESTILIGTRPRIRDDENKGKAS